MHQRYRSNISDTQRSHTTLLFSVSNRIGALDDVLKAFTTHGVNLSSIESRPSKTAEWDYDFFVELMTVDSNLLHSIVETLGSTVKDVKIVGTGDEG